MYCKDSIEIGSTIIEGGNMLVSGNYAFIGRDVLEYYKDDSNTLAIDKLGLDTNNNNEAQIDSALKKSLSLEKDFQIVWIGTGDARYNYDPDGITWYANGKRGFYHIPLFHLDMFFNPGPIVNDSMLYLKGKLINLKSSTDTSEKRALDSLNTWISDAVDSVLNQKMKKFILKSVEVELPIIFESGEGGKAKISEVSGHCNGLFEYRNDTLTYLLPLASDTVDSVAQGIMNKLDQVGINVIPIPLSSKKKSGLHCKVKVVGREN